MEECNAILFVFATAEPRKYILKITRPQNFMVFNKFSLKVDIINPILPEHLPNGSIDDLGKIGDVHIYIFKFNNTTRCSDVSDIDIPCRDDPDPINMMPTKLKANVGWSFFPSLQILN